MHPLAVQFADSCLPAGFDLNSIVSILQRKQPDCASTHSPVKIISRDVQLRSTVPLQIESAPHLRYSRLLQ